MVAITLTRPCPQSVARICGAHVAANRKTIMCGLVRKRVGRSRHAPVSRLQHKWFDYVDKNGESPWVWISTRLPVQKWRMPPDCNKSPPRPVRRSLSVPMHDSMTVHRARGGLPGAWRETDRAARSRIDSVRRLVGKRLPWLTKLRFFVRAARREPLHQRGDGGDELRRIDRLR